MQNTRHKMTIEFCWYDWRWETYCNSECCQYDNYTTWAWYDLYHAWKAYKTW